VTNDQSAACSFHLFDPILPKIQPFWFDSWIFNFRTSKRSFC